MRPQIGVVTGNVRKDTNALAKQLGVDANVFKSKDFSSKYVLHHLEDGRVGFIPREIHDVGLSGSTHLGFRSIQDSKLF